LYFLVAALPTRPYSGHTTRTSLEIYSKIALSHAQDAYDTVIDTFPV
jgi:integrase/recombinase XerD